MHNVMARTPELRAAHPADSAAIERLLAECDLPISGVTAIVSARPADFIVADDPDRPGELAAVGGLEVCSETALLRSVAVRPAWRKHGLGDALVRRLVSDAEGRGLRALYLLTMTAEAYFPRFGFERVGRDAVPAEIAATDEFRSTCPSTAVAMCRSVGVGPSPGGR